MYNIVVIDGQGGGIGRQIIAGIKQAEFDATVTAVGTNSFAANAMLKAGADRAATGENAIVAACRYADFITGPLGIVIADSLLGEITPKMAVAVGQSRAKKVLIPVNLCGSIIVNTPEQPMSAHVAGAVQLIQQMARSH